jgi:Tol biopolymer transport system component
MRLISESKIDAAVATRLFAMFLLITVVALSQAIGSSIQEPTTKEEKKEAKKPDAFSVRQLTHLMGLYAIGPVSPDGKSILLIAQKPDAAPNLYIMNIVDHSIRPPLTTLKWGVAAPQWSPDGQSVAFAGFSETASFDEIFTLDLNTTTVRQLTKNSFGDKEPVFTPDGKRLLYTSDESPLPDAAFGILHVASISIVGGKPAYFTEDECSSIHPRIAADRKSVLLIKVSDASGRHSLWQYGLDGKPQRDLTELRFARINGYLTGAAGGLIVLWAQEQAEQQDDIYLLDPSSGKVRELPEPDLPKHNPALSPDGKLIAFIGPANFGAQLFLYDSTTNQIKQLTFKPGNTHSPMFVSNTEILLGSNRDRENELYLLDLSQPFEEKKKK